MHGRADGSSSRINHAKYIPLFPGGSSIFPLPRPAVDFFFFERTAQDSACFIDIAEKSTRIQLWKAIVRKKKRKEKQRKGCPAVDLKLQ